MKARSSLVEELRKSMNKRLFQSQITAQTNKFHGMRIGRSTAPGPSNTPDQITWRARYAACVVTWNALTPEQKAAYQEDADKRRITAYNQFLSECLTVPAEKLYERYITNDDAGSRMWGDLWLAQSFTIGNTGDNEDHSITKLVLLLYRLGSPGTVTVGIRAVDGEGKPTGPDLAIGTTNGNTLPTAAPYEWREITLTPYALLANTQYQIVGRAESVTEVNRVLWRKDQTDPTYGGGVYGFSDNGGSTWTLDSTQDRLFKEYGIPA